MSVCNEIDQLDLDQKLEPLIFFFEKSGKVRRTRLVVHIIEIVIQLPRPHPFS